MTKTTCPWGLFILCWLAGSASGMTANMMALFVAPVISSFTEFPDKALISQIGSWMQSAFLLGWAVGGITIGFASDRFGRVIALAFAVLVVSLFSGLAALSDNIWHFLICRFFAGLGVGGAMVNISLLVAERWPSRTRTVAVGSLLTSYQAGVFASGIVAYFLPEWRLAFAVGAAPLLLSATIFFVLKEIPREKGPQIGFRKAAPLKPLILGGLLFGSLLVAYWASLSWIPTWIQEAAGSGTGLEKSRATMWHGFAAICGCILAGPLVNRIGRIRVLFICFFIAFAVTLCMLWSHQSFSSLIYVEFAMIGVAVGMAQAALYIYLPELFPACNRGRDVGICLNAGRFATVAAVLSGGVLIPLLGGYAQGITFFAFAYIAALVAAVCSRETRGAEFVSL